VDQNTGQRVLCQLHPDSWRTKNDGPITCALTLFLMRFLHPGWPTRALHPTSKLGRLQQRLQPQQLSNRALNLRVAVGKPLFLLETAYLRALSSDSGFQLGH